MDSELTSKDALTLSVAFLGAGLGIFNTWRAYKKDRPLLKVVPKQAIPVGAEALLDPRPRICIEVTNLSTFPLTITEVGFVLVGSTKRAALLPPIIRDGGPFPRRLEARTSFTAYASPDTTLRPGEWTTEVYAITDCGERFTGTGPALSMLRHEDHD
ncbi:MAG: hypothetical protein K8S98_02140 [Planctomycetes bacterium]|nr:hypothetical protein [Planctomycetota bacterium]